MQDGVSLLPTVRNPRRRPNRLIQIEATAPLFRQNLPANQWDRPWHGVRTDRYTYVEYPEAGDQELYDRRKDPYQLRNVAKAPSYRKVKKLLQRKLAKLDRCKGRSCMVRP